jgi:hypothetical protein
VLTGQGDATDQLTLVRLSWRDGFAVAGEDVSGIQPEVTLCILRAVTLKAGLLKDGVNVSGEVHGFPLGEKREENSKSAEVSEHCARKTQCAVPDFRRSTVSMAGPLAALRHRATKAGRTFPLGRTIPAKAAVFARAWRWLRFLFLGLRGRPTGDDREEGEREKDQTSHGRGG